MWFLDFGIFWALCCFAHGELACWLFHEPHTGLDDCLRMLLPCFRKRMSGSISCRSLCHPVSATMHYHHHRSRRVVRPSQTSKRGRGGERTTSNNNTWLLLRVLSHSLTLFHSQNEMTSFVKTQMKETLTHSLSQGALRMISNSTRGLSACARCCVSIKVGSGSQTCPATVSAL